MKHSEANCKKSEVVTDESVNLVYNNSVQICRWIIFSKHLSNAFCFNETIEMSPTRVRNLFKGFWIIQSQHFEFQRPEKRRLKSSSLKRASLLTWRPNKHLTSYRLCWQTPRSIKLKPPLKQQKRRWCPIILRLKRTCNHWKFSTVEAMRSAQNAIEREDPSSIPATARQFLPWELDIPSCLKSACSEKN